MIETRGLTRRFGHKTVLQNLNFNAQAGESVLLLGQNGSGKSTLIRMLAGLLRPHSGQISLLGYGIGAQLPILRRKLGVILHQPLLYEQLTAAENLKLYAALYDIDNPPAQIDFLLQRFGMKRHADEIVRTFSRGMKQRLALARALLNSPQILLLDEPYTGLDQAGCEVLNTILQTQSQLGNTILMTTHDLTYASQAATRIDFLADRHITESLPADGITPAELAERFKLASAAEGVSV